MSTWPLASRDEHYAVLCDRCTRRKFGFNNEAALRVGVGWKHMKSLLECGRCGARWILSMGGEWTRFTNTGHMELSIKEKDKA